MGNFHKKVEAKVRNLNECVKEKKFFTLTGLRLYFELEGRRKKRMKVKVSAISGADQVRSMIGTCSLEKCEKIFNIVQHVLALDCSINIEEDSTCSICLEHFADTVLNCGHQFCLEDIKSWANRNQECPMCRHPFAIDEGVVKVEGTRSDLKHEIKICKDEMFNLIDTNW